jgi:hypothetical protein
MKSPRLYRKVASSHKMGVATGGWISLYTAADHLLLRTSSGFLENYRRFYFADIEAITVRRTARGLYWNVVLVIGLLVSLVVMWENQAPHVATGAFAGFFVFLLILNVAFGATCVTQLQTRVQSRALPIRRVRKALRVVDRLFKRIEDAQAQIAVAAPIETQGQPLASVMPAARLSVPPPLPGENPARRGSWLHAAVFALLLLTGAIAIVAGLQHSAPLRNTACAALLANLPLGIVALVQQRRYRLPSRPGVIVWISVIAHSFLIPTFYFVFSFMHAVEMTKTGGPPPAPLTMQLPLSDIGNLPSFDRVLWIWGLFCAVLALIGLFAMLPARERMESATTG